MTKSNQVKEYNYLLGLKNDEVILKEFNNYKDGFIIDIFDEISDSLSEIYYYELDKIKDKIKDYVESIDDDEFEESLKSDTLTLKYYEKIQMAHIKYNQDLLLNNFEEIIFNYAINYLIKYEKIYNGSSFDYELLEIELKHRININNTSEIQDIIDIIENNFLYEY